ncbi:hypothetical protein DYBT9275_02485 [Dyadobacter sp. CECT 9275]|uniref:Uncharacterized protein n=1 Tax=Dyadobacter helix TaxID=2822344 RepID=A0A916JC77_9BACT|nr:hypothetical protein [Dyadobacter sp. CECT 9275]CAG5000546.1 hypothetical protein DYBT9275_02485 [Dyadobacter sp. CECT 9275]
MKLSGIIAKTFFASAMLLTSTSIFAQVKIGTNPTAIEAASNLEVEASTAGRKVKVDKTTGQLTIKDGTEGSNKVLFSDAVGGSSWKKLKLMEIFSFTQVSGIQLVVPVGNSLCQDGSINPPACAKDLNLNGSFNIHESTSDVVLETLSIYTSIGNVAGSKNQFTLMLYVDKTTPGVFESVGYTLETSSTVGCNAKSVGLKAVLKDLPVRATPYQVKTFVGPWSNDGQFAAVVGLGKAAVEAAPSVSPCGTSPAEGNNKLTITVIQ